MKTPKKKKINVEDLILEEAEHLVKYLEKRYNCEIKFNIDEIKRIKR